MVRSLTGVEWSFRYFVLLDDMVDSAHRVRFVLRDCSSAFDRGSGSQPCQSDVYLITIGQGHEAGGTGKGSRKPESFH